MRLFTIFMTLSIAFGVTKANSQISVNPWGIHEGTEGVLKHRNSIHGDPNAYKLAKIPTVKDAGWKMAPKDAKGDVSMKRASVILCREEIDFTYFQTIVNIPSNTTVTDFKVSYDNADDGARIYLFNSKFPNGTFDPKSDLVGKHANFASTNLKDLVAPGENRIVIVQFDDCADNNSINGIRVSVNGKEVAPVTPVAPTTVKNDPNGGVTIFEHINFGGKKCTFGVGSYDITGTEYNDIISSIKVLSGWKVTLYEHWKYTGAKVEVTSDVNALNTLKFNDKMSSFVVERVSSSVSSSGVNIAKGKQCRASSVNFGGEASRAVDGNTNGEYGNNSCTHTNDEKDPWLEIDLGAVYDVSSIKIWNRTDDCCWNRLQGFYVMGYETAITSCSTSAEYQYNGSSYSFTSASQSSISIDGNKRCRYIRVFIPGNIKILSLAEVEIFGQLAKVQTTTTAPVATSLPDKFKVLAFSVHEGKKEQDKYWFAINNGGSRGSILSTSKLVNGSKWLEIQRVDLGNNIFAFKVLNAGADMYLVARDNKEVHIEKATTVPEGAKFKTVAPLTSAKGANENNYRSFESVKFSGHYLRHAGYVLFVHPNDKSELFKQDASWLIEKM